jgi:hypothetical protein
MFTPTVISLPPVKERTTQSFAATAFIFLLLYSGSTDMRILFSILKPKENIFSELENFGWKT